MSGLFDKYVELHVRLWEKIDYLNKKYIQVPEWYAKMWGMPDSTWKRAGKNLAYHVGHITAVLLGVVVVGAIIAAIV